MISCKYGTTGQIFGICDVAVGKKLLMSNNVWTLTHTRDDPAKAAFRGTGCAPQHLPMWRAPVPSTVL